MNRAERRELDKFLKRKCPNCHRVRLDAMEIDLDNALCPHCGYDRTPEHMVALKLIFLA